jgi:hypothetical protein
MLCRSIYLRYAINKNADLLDMFVLTNISNKSAFLFLLA